MLLLGKGGFSPYIVNGAEPELGVFDTVWFAVTSSTSLFRQTGDPTANHPDEKITQGLLRLVGPTLIALTFLAMRNRVKR